MAWRLDKAVVKGEIDNRTKGVVTGKIWLIGTEQPIELTLEGNGWQDMAGHLLMFENPSPEQPEDEHTDLNLVQNGLVGDMTASRKVRVFDIPVEDALEMSRRGEKPPEHMANCLYLEWYSDFNGRVVIESVDYRISISEPAWLMTAEEETEQRKTNGEAIVKWMERLTGALNAAQRREEIDAAKKKRPARDDDAPMNEFEWEQLMKESDARTDKLMELYEKYDGIEPEERERLIAREMGWTHIEEYLDAKANGELPDRDEEAWDTEDFEMPEPDPLTEGIDWIRSDDGRPVHPLYRRCFDLVLGFRDDCKQAGWLDEYSENPLNDLLFAGHMVTAKLAGGLNSLWMDHDMESGFIVAYLKRALKYFNEAMEHYQHVQAAGLVDPQRLACFHSDFCSVREEILLLMDKYRGNAF